MTSQRRAILDAARALTPGHFDVSDVLARLDKSNVASSKYGRSTVYRTLELFVECGILRKLHLGSRAAAFELVIETEHHEHLLCEVCGKIIEFECPEIERLQDEICEGLNFVPTSHILRITGICDECRDK